MVSGAAEKLKLKLKNSLERLNKISTGEAKLLKCVLSQWYQIKGLMTSKGPGHFLSVLPGAQTYVLLDLDFPCSTPLCLAATGPFPGERAST